MQERVQNKNISYFNFVTYLPTLKLKRIFFVNTNYTTMCNVLCNMLIFTSGHI